MVPKGTKILAIVFFVCALALGFATAPRTHADTASDLQQKIDAQNKALADLQAEIAQYQQQLVAIGKNKNTLANAVAQLNLESKQISAQIKVTEGKISSANLKLQSLGDSIAKTSASIDDLKAAIGKNIRDVNEQDTNTLSSMLAGGKNISDLWHYAAEQSAFRISLQQKTGQLNTTKAVLVTNQSQVQKTKAELLTLDNQLRDQKTINQRTQAQQLSLLTATKNQESSYQKLIAQKQALESQMEGDLRDYESKLKYVLNPKSLPPAGSSPLAWPLDHIVITQLFGKTSDSGRLYASGTHNGVDFGAPIGTPVKAMASGIVVGSGNTDLTCPRASYGMWVYIKYDNGLSSLYGHLSLIKSTTVPGARVNTGDVVAYTGQTGYATGPHLHLTIIAADAGSIQSFPSKACSGRNYTAPVAALNAYLDPMLYLPKG